MRANYNRTSAWTLLSSSSISHRPFLASATCSIPTFFRRSVRFFSSQFFRLLTNNIKRPILWRIMLRYNSRTSGHRKRALERRIGGIESGRTCVMDTTRRCKEKRRGAARKLFSDYIPAISSPTYDSVRSIVRRARCRFLITGSRRASLV